MKPPAPTLAQLHTLIDARDRREDRPWEGQAEIAEACREAGWLRAVDVQLSPRRRHAVVYQLTPLGREVLERVLADRGWRPSRAEGFIDLSRLHEHQPDASDR